MSKKTSIARRAAFFRALAETGNQTVAAERAKVSRSWVSLHRASDPAFRTEMEAAILAAREGLRGVAGSAPGRHWGDIAGEELVIRGSNGRRAQIARARVRQWTARAEARFLRALAASCNVKAACAETGLSVASAYNHRRRWQGFARRWVEAEENGYIQLEFALIENASNMLEGGAEVEAGGPMPPMTISQAIHLLHMHKFNVRRMGRKPGGFARPRDYEALSAEILRKLTIIERHEARLGAGASL